MNLLNILILNLYIIKAELFLNWEDSFGERGYVMLVTSSSMGVGSLCEVITTLANIAGGIFHIRMLKRLAVLASKWRFKKRKKGGEGRYKKSIHFKTLEILSISV